MALMIEVFILKINYQVKPGTPGGERKVMQPPIYPFSAIVGQEKMRSALLLNAVDASIGGVLISGQKGTGKSTAVRGLPGILPRIVAVRDCPFNCDPAAVDQMCAACRARTSAGESLATVMRSMPLVELPLSATEDRVVGTLHVEHALKTGGRVFDPGIMASANRGILYVDEVNLLDDHLVDVLLDAAASGVNIVEREGISHIHPARFLLVGTMNPEEGDLRPQFLDRFGLSLSVQSEASGALRSAIVRRRLSFDANPSEFAARWRAFDDLLSEQVLQARTRLKDVEIPDATLDLAVALTVAAQAQGHRSEIAIVKTARAVAALLETNRVEPAHVAEAARLVLPHRMAQTGLDSVEGLARRLDDLIGTAIHGETAPKDLNSGDTVESEEDWDEITTEVPGAWAASNVDMVFSYLEEKKKLFLTPMH